MSDPEATLLEKLPCYRDLQGRVALVTGGGTGIGRGIALRLASEGMKVAICGRRRGPLEETAGVIEARGGTAFARPTDVREAGEVRALFKEVEERLGPVDALIHNAVLMRMDKFEKIQSELWEASFATGPAAAYLLAQRALPGMRQRGRGGIVVISSVGAIRAHLSGLPYDAAKAALEAMVRGLAIECAPDGIRVNGVAPGATHTRGEETKAALANEHIPMRRKGTPAEMAAAVAFLLSDQASYLTGQTIYLDGGLTAQLSPPGIWV